MSALRPLFAAAGALLLIALVVLAVRGGDGPAVPTAGGTVSPGDTAVDDPTSVAPSDDEDAAEPTPDATTPDGATGSATEADPSAPSDGTACGVACGDDEPTASESGGTRPQAAEGSGSEVEGSESEADGSETEGSETEGSGATDGSASDDGTTGEDGDDGDGREVVAIGEVDDMPDTGGGALSLVGALVLVAGLGIARRR